MAAISTSSLDQIAGFAGEFKRPSARRKSICGEVMRPSALGASEIALWHQMQAQTRSLQRAFFALACERATGRAYVLILDDGSTIRGFLPFQFQSAWHQRLRLAERIGVDLSDAAGVIALSELGSTRRR